MPFHRGCICSQISNCTPDGREEKDWKWQQNHPNKYILAASQFHVLCFHEELRGCVIFLCHNANAKLSYDKLKRNKFMNWNFILLSKYGVAYCGILPLNLSTTWQFYSLYLNHYFEHHLSWNLEILHLVPYHTRL